MKKTNRSAEKGKPAAGQPQSTIRPAPLAGVSAKRQHAKIASRTAKTPPAAAEPPAHANPSERSLGEQIGTFYEGITKHSLHRRGTRFIHAIHHRERFTGRGWRTINADNVGKEYAAGLARFKRESEQAERLHGVAAANRTKSPFRTRVERHWSTFDEALVIVRDKILFPAIGAAIPSCFDRDLCVMVYMTLHSNRRERAAASHVVGATPLEMPADMEYFGEGRFRRRKPSASRTPKKAR